MELGVLQARTSFTFTAFFHYNLGEESLAMITFFCVGIAVALDRMITVPAALDIPSAPGYLPIAFH